jgi:hypothetical protein
LSRGDLRAVFAEIRGIASLPALNPTAGGKLGSSSFEAQSSAGSTGPRPRDVSSPGDHERAARVLGIRSRALRDNLKKWGVAGAADDVPGGAA